MHRGRRGRRRGGRSRSEGRSEQEPASAIAGQARFRAIEGQAFSLKALKIRDQSATSCDTKCVAESLSFEEFYGLSLE